MRWHRIVPVTREGVSAAVYPFRHVEEPLLMASIISTLIAIVAFKYGMYTVGRFQIVVWAVTLALIAGVIIWLRLRRYFSPVMKKIVQGEKRVALVAMGISACLTVVLCTVGLVANRHFPQETVREVDAVVRSTGKVSGPKIWGWDMNVEFEGRSHYQMISLEQYQIVTCARVVRLRLRRGLLGLEWIDGLSAGGAVKRC